MSGEHWGARAMAVDLKEKSDEEIRVWIENHERKKVTNTPLYLALVEEQARRRGRGLKTAISIDHLAAAAREQHYTTYGALAEASGVPWTEARHLMNGAGGHLDQLLSICHAKGLPLLSAICVNQQAVQTGRLAGDSLIGFTKGAMRLGYAVTDPEAFLRKCQDACFEWGRNAAARRSG